MSTATGPIPTGRRDGEIIPVALAAVKVYHGAAAAIVNGIGYGTPLVPATSTHRFVGLWGETYDNSAGSAGGYFTQVVRKGCFKFSQTGTTITFAHINTNAYFSDDNTVTLTAGTTWAGVIAAVDADGGVWVDIDLAVLYTSPPLVVTPTSLAGVEQDLNAASTVKRYAIGAKLVTSDNRVFRYCKAGTGGVQSEFGAVLNQSAIASAVAPTQASGAGAIASTTVTVTIGASAGPNGDGSIAVNELAGGYVWIGNGTSQHPQCRCITANTVVAGGGGVCTLTLDHALTAAITEGVTYIEAFVNPYGYITSANVTNSAYVSVLGVPAVTTDVANYFWLQTWGPVWVTSAGITGEYANGRDLFFETNGSVASTSNGSTKIGLQRAGHAMDKSASNASNSPMLMLQLDR